MLKLKFDSLNELPKDKKPPRGLLDKPFALNDYLDEVFSSKSNKESEFVEFSLEEAE